MDLGWRSISQVLLFLNGGDGGKTETQRLSRNVLNGKYQEDALRPRAGLREERAASARTPLWGLEQRRWLVSLCYQSDDAEGRCYTASAFPRDGNSAFQRESWERRTQNRDKWRCLTKRIKGLRGKRSKRLKPKTLSVPLDGLNFVLSWRVFCHPLQNFPSF